MPPSNPFCGLRRKNVTIIALNPKGDAKARRDFCLWHFARQAFGNAALAPLAIISPRTDLAIGGAWCADSCSQIHQGLGKITGALLWDQCLRFLSDQGLCGRQRCFNGVKPCHYALHIAINGGMGPVKGNAAMAAEV